MKRIDVTKTMIRILPALLLFVFLVSAATAESAADLLEQGVYTEETVGDLAAAIDIYQRLLQDASTGRALAAQAQYRIGLSHQKAGDPVAALAAFEKVIDSFPDQAEVVAKARQHLPTEAPLEPVPWSDGEKLSYRMKLPTGLELGTLISTAATTVIDGEAAWHLELRRFIAVGHPDNQGISRVDARESTFAPIRSLFKHTILGKVEKTYGTDQAELRIWDVEGKENFQDLQIEPGTYDNEQAIFLMRRMPLEVGYSTVMQVVPPVLATILPIGVEVVDKEMIEVPAGKFECYKVELSIQQTFWFSADEHRYLVRFDAEGIHTELAAVGLHSHNERLMYYDDELGFSFSAPAGWLTYTFDLDDRGAVAVQLLDPDASLVGRLEVYRRTSDDGTLEKWVRAEVERLEKGLEGYAVRESSWKEEPVAGRPAISYIASFVLDGKEISERRLYQADGRLRTKFVFRQQGEMAEMPDKAIASILSSYRSE